jgi:hypothetical protein
VADGELLTLEVAARVAGHARWLETRLFEVLGQWVQSEPDAATKIFWATRSRRHAEHAEGWRRHQPVVAHLDPDALAVAAGAPATAVVEALAGLREPGYTAIRLDGAYRVVVPALVAAYRLRVVRAHPLADGPVVSWVKGVAADESAACRQAEQLLARLGGATGATEPATVDSRLGALMGADGGLIGLAPIAV